jgi:mRNA-degrading endonuclease RelE of RelBE toxin-antitoxin system
MTPYGIITDKSVLEELDDPKRYPAKVQLQILKKVLTLSSNPRPADCKQLDKDIYRVTSYRIIYTIDDLAKFITVFLIDKRGDDEVYRRLERRT